MHVTLCEFLIDLKLKVFAKYISFSVCGSGCDCEGWGRG